MKVCSKCNIGKPLDSFHKRSNRPCGVRSICKDCYKQYPRELKRSEGYTRNYDLQRSYSITTAGYNELLESQGGKCKICGVPQNTLTGHKKNLCVDHDHNTGKIRGIICDKCNRGIGLLNDSEETLRAALSYLEQARLTEIF